MNALAGRLSPVVLGLMLLAEAPVAASAESPLARGYLYRGPGVSLFEPCGSATGYWMGDIGAARDLFPRYDALTRRDYERVFVSVRGHVRALRRGEPIPVEYAGVYEVEAVFAVRLPAAGDCG